MQNRSKSFHFTPLRCLTILLLGALLNMVWQTRTPTHDLAQYGIDHALEQIQ